MSSPFLSEAERLAAETLALCQIPSVIGQEGPLCDAVEARLRADDRLRVERVGNSVLARGPSLKRPLVALVGHLDTVPAPPALGDPTPRREGGRIYGLGSSDMKSGLAVMLRLVETLPLSEIPYDLAWIFYDREEGPFLESGLGPVFEQIDWLPQIRLAFCLEPSDNEVQVGCMGALHARVTFKGRAAHSARPWQGENAIHKAGALLSALYARQPVDVEIQGFLFREVLSATMAQGGRKRNIIPDEFVLNLNYRFAPGKSLSQACEDVRAFVGEGASVEFVDLSPSGRVVADNSLLQRFVALTSASVAGKQAWTDVARFSEAGIDAVNFGPGLSSQAHQAGEYAEIELIARGYQMLHGFLTAP